MRLIDADELRNDWLQNGQNEYVYDTNAFLESIDNAPTVDAEPVVRCEYCIWHRERNKKEQAYLIEGVLICTNVEATDGGWLPVFPTHFCSYGERKDGE